MAKFDIIIGNPPYEGKGAPLYLQILDKIIPFANEVCWLCPSQWVKNYKDGKFLSDFKKRNKLTSHKFTGNPFDDAGLANEVGVFVFDKDIKDKEDYEEIRLERFLNPTLAKSIWKKFEKYKDNLYNHDFFNTEKPYSQDFCVNAPWIRGHFRESKPCWDWTTLFGKEDKNNFKFKKLIQTHHWYFKSEVECKNFIASTETDILMFANYIGKINNSTTKNSLLLMPWLGDYTHEWAEAEIAKEIGLTQEEVDYIHEEMKDFGWKTRNKDA